MVSIGYHGNVVNLWERLVEELEKTGELLVDMGSDQTSCHNPFNGGYYPVQLGYEESQKVTVLARCDCWRNNTFLPDRRTFHLVEILVPHFVGWWALRFFLLP